jgi:hypothetical protein
VLGRSGRRTAILEERNRSLGTADRAGLYPPELVEYAERQIRAAPRAGSPRRLAISGAVSGCSGPSDDLLDADLSPVLIPVRR